MRKWTARVVLVLAVTTFAACQTTPKGPVYLIKLEPGDTLAAIAAKYDTTWKDIVELNELKDSRDLRAGRVIRVIPGPGGHATNEASLARKSAPARSKAQAVARRGKLAGTRAADAASDGELPELELMPDSEVSGDDDGAQGGLLFGGSSSTRLSWPVDGEISSLYGPRQGSFHQGLDIRAKHGTEVRAAAAGKVIFAGRMNGYGKIVIVQHKKMKTYYAHLSSIDVRKGKALAAGDAIGEVGSTGHATGPHLHFEVRDARGKSLDPLAVLPKNELYSKNP